MPTLLYILTTPLATWLSVEGVAIGNADTDGASQDHVIVTRAPNEVQSDVRAMSELVG